MLSFLKMKIKLLLISDLWHGTVDINNVKHLKRYKQRINACSMASYKMVGLVLPEDEKKIELIFD